MKHLTIYGNRFFDAEPGGGTPAVQTPTVETPPNGKELPKEVKDRMDYLEAENKKLISARDQAKEKVRKEEEEKLKQQGELKTLLEAKEKELEALKPKVDAFELFKQSEIAEAKKALGDKWDDEFANLSLPALRKMVSTLSGKKPDSNPDTGANGKTVELTDPQKIEAKTMGLSDADYIEVMKNRKVKK